MDNFGERFGQLFGPAAREAGPLERFLTGLLTVAESSLPWLRRLVDEMRRQRAKED